MWSGQKKSISLSLLKDIFASIKFSFDNFVFFWYLKEVFPCLLDCAVSCENSLVSSLNLMCIFFSVWFYILSLSFVLNLIVMYLIVVLIFFCLKFIVLLKFVCLLFSWNLKIWSLHLSLSFLSHSIYYFGTSIMLGHLKFQADCLK